MRSAFSISLRSPIAPVRALLSAVLLVADLLHPVDVLAVAAFPEWRCASSPSSAWRRANASRRAETRPHRPAGFPRLGPPQLCTQPTAGRDDQRLAERMGVPGGAGARLERNLAAGDAAGLGRLEQRIDADRAREIVRRVPCRTAASQFV